MQIIRATHIRQKKKIETLIFQTNYYLMLIGIFDI
jgi:hypothetical protein